MVGVAIPELPADTRYVRAVLGSEALLRQQARSVFACCDLNRNGQIERDELAILCEAMHEKIGLHVFDQVELGRRLAKHDADFSGGLDADQFIGLYKDLLEDAIGDPHLTRATGEEIPKAVSKVVREMPRLQSIDGIAAELPSDPRYLRAVLSSETLVRKQAASVFVQCDRDWNGQIDRDELFGLCLAMHQSLGVKLPDDIGVGLQLAKFDEDFSGGLDREEFLRLYKHLLRDALKNLSGTDEPYCARALSQPAKVTGLTAEKMSAIQKGDRVLAPYLGETGGRRYHALVTSLTEAFDGSIQVGLRWLRPPAGKHAEEYASGFGLDDTEYTRVPQALVSLQHETLAGPDVQRCESKVLSI